MTRRQGRRRKQLLDNLKDKRGYCHLKEEAVDRNMWRHRFGRGFEPVVRQTTGLYIYNVGDCADVLWLQLRILCLAWGTSNRNAKDSVLLGYDCTWLGNRIPTFRRNMVFSSSRFEMSEIVLHRLEMSESVYSNDSAPYPSVAESSAAPPRKYRNA